MCKLRKTGIKFIILLLLITVMSCLVSCKDTTDEEVYIPIETEDDYPVAGIWHAQAIWHEDSPYNYGGDTFQLDIWYDFRENGTMRSKLSLTINGYSYDDSLSDWFTANVTWSVSGNVIKLSNGNQYVIENDEFTDLYPEPEMILHYKKEKSE